MNQTITPADVIKAYGLSPDKAEALRCLLAPADQQELQNLWRARSAVSEAIKVAERNLLPGSNKDCSGCKNACTGAEMPANA